MLTIFQVCFYVGLGLIIISFLFGSIFEAFGIDGLDLDFDFIGLDIYLPVSPILYIVFAIVFGGVGWILSNDRQNIPSIIIIGVAIIAGIIVSALLRTLVIKPLKNAQNTSTPTSEDLVGLNALVTESIQANGFGEISYVINGNSYTSPAKNIEEEKLVKGKEVAICWIEDYIFYVTSLDKVSESTKKEVKS